MESRPKSFWQDNVRLTMIGPRSVRLQYETNALFYRRIWIDPCNLESSMLLFKRGALTDRLAALQ